jgi:hypothetical protein
MTFSLEANGLRLVLLSTYTVNYGKASPKVSFFGGKSWELVDAIAENEQQIY